MAAVPELSERPEPFRPEPDPSGPAGLSGSRRPEARRDLFLDALRLLVIVVVVAQHLLLPVLSREGGALVLGSVLDTPGAFALTWAAQVMPLIFFVGGAANAMSLQGARPRETAPWLVRRLRRLGWPVLLLVAVCLPLSGLSLAAGAAEQPIRLAGEAAGMVLWFLAAYVMVVVLTPWAHRADARFGWWVPVVLLFGAAVVDLLRFAGGNAALGYLNVGFVWLGVHQLGVRYASSPVSAGTAAAMALGGSAAAVLLAAAGPYSLNMTGVFATAESNVNPPTLMLAALAAGQIGAALLLRPRITLWTSGPAAARLMEWARPRLMAVYLWHMTAVAAAAAVLVFGFGTDTPRPFTGPWLVWCGAATALSAPMLWLLLRCAPRLEEPPQASYGAPGAVRAAGAAVLIAGGLLALTATGLVWGAAPLAGALALAAGLALTWSPRQM